MSKALSSYIPSVLNHLCILHISNLSRTLECYIHSVLGVSPMEDRTHALALTVIVDYNGRYLRTTVFVSLESIVAIIPMNKAMWYKHMTFSTGPSPTETFLIDAAAFPALTAQYKTTLDTLAALYTFKAYLKNYAPLFEAAHDCQVNAVIAYSTIKEILAKIKSSYPFESSSKVDLRPIEQTIPHPLLNWALLSPDVMKFLAYSDTVLNAIADDIAALVDAMPYDTGGIIYIPTFVTCETSLPLPQNHHVLYNVPTRSILSPVRCTVRFDNPSHVAHKNYIRFSRDTAHILLRDFPYDKHESALSIRVRRHRNLLDKINNVYSQHFVTTMGELGPEKSEQVRLTGGIELPPEAYRILAEWRFVGVGD